MPQLNCFSQDLTQYGCWLVEEAHCFGCSCLCFCVGISAPGAMTFGGVSLCSYAGIWSCLWRMGVVFIVCCCSLRMCGDWGTLAGSVFADQWVAKGSGNGLGGKTEKAFKRELGGLGFTPKASPENGGGVKEVPAGRLQQDSE